MSSSFRLRILTPGRLVLDEEVIEVTAPGTVGEFGVLPNHATFLSSIEIGSLTFRSERGARSVAIRGGFAEVEGNIMTVLAEAAEFPEEVDATRAEQTIREAAVRLAGLSTLQEEYAETDAERRWAQARLDVFRKS